MKGSKKVLIIFTRGNCVKKIRTNQKILADIE